MGMNSFSKTATRHRRGCDLIPCPSAPQSSTLTTRLPKHPTDRLYLILVLLAYVSCSCAIVVLHSHCVSAILSFLIVLFYFVLLFNMHVFIVLLYRHISGLRPLPMMFKKLIDSRFRRGRLLWTQGAMYY